MPDERQFQHDVFVSYAHVDDEHPAVVSRGWVSELQSNLEITLRRKLSKDVNVWIDHELAMNAPVTPALLESLRNTALMLVVTSPGYLSSEWCLKERQAFREFLAGRQRSGSRTFMVERDRVERTDLPAEFQDLIPIRFWELIPETRATRTLGDPAPSAEEHEYWNRVNQLAHEIADELRRLDRPATAPVASADRPRAFLAQCTDDLETQEEDMRRFLSQAGVEVLPAQAYPLGDAASFETAMRADLARCQVYVQMVGQLKGRRLWDSSPRFPVLQRALAASSGVPCLVWRPEAAKPGSTDDPDHNQLLDSARNDAFEEFKRAVGDAVKRKPEPPPRPVSINQEVFINAVADDRHIAVEIGKLLSDQGISCVYPVVHGTPEDVRKDLEDSLTSCDALLVIYGTATVTWVRGQLRQMRKIIRQRERPVAAIAVCEAPPGDQEDLGLLLPGMRVVNCRTGLTTAALADFFAALSA